MSVTLCSYDWTKDGKPIGSMSNILYVGNGTIHMSQLMRANEGIYQCFAGNMYGCTMSTIAELRMAVTDSSSPETNHIAVAAGHPVMIGCRETTICFPSPYYSWQIKFNIRSVPIRMDSRRQMDEKGNCCCLCYCKYVAIFNKK